MVEQWSPKPPVGGSNPSWPVGIPNKEIVMKKIVKYFKECWLELKKVSWPSRQMVLQSTKVVIVSTVVFALILGLVDFLLLKGIFLIF